jgi:hypothetical protein
MTVQGHFFIGSLKALGLLHRSAHFPLAMPPASVRPFSGYVETTADALRLIQAARCGLIPRITRRLNELERRSMIKSGAVFVFSVDESGIKRWTDGRLSRPSHVPMLSFYRRVHLDTEPYIWKFSSTCRLHCCDWFG